MTRRCAFRVHGLVQGVGFRYFTRRKAHAYNLTGWCRNTLHGRVEGEAQGDDRQLEKFLSDIKKGPSHASVSRVDEKDLEIVDGEESFEVRH